MSFLNNKTDIQQWLKEMNIKNFIINDDLTVDVNGSVDLKRKNLNFIPVQFNTVKGTFYCSHNNLTSLKGVPFVVEESFSCSHNQLTTLEYSPKEVKSSFFCSRNKLTSLQGCPETIYGAFGCENNQLISLKYGPKNVANSFHCPRNLLVTLEDAPETVGGDFICSNNPLISMRNFNTVFKGNLAYSTDIDKEINLEGFNEIFGGGQNITHAYLKAVLLKLKLEGDFTQNPKKTSSIKL